MGLAVADRHAAGHGDVPAELPKGQHFQPPVTHGACCCRSFGEVSQRRRQLRHRFMRPPAYDASAGVGLAVASALRRLQRLRGQGGRIGDGEPAEGLIGGG